MFALLYCTYVLYCILNSTSNSLQDLVWIGKLGIPKSCLGLINPPMEASKETYTLRRQKKSALWFNLIINSDSGLKLHVKVKVKSLSHVRPFVMLWTVAHQAPPSMGFSRWEYWSGLPFPSPRDLPNPGIEPRSPTLQADALTSEPPGKPSNSIGNFTNHGRQ